jgi:hypothetical protein
MELITACAPKKKNGILAEMKDMWGKTIHHLKEVIPPSPE